MSPYRGNGNVELSIRNVMSIHCDVGFEKRIRSCVQTKATEALQYHKHPSLSSNFTGSVQCQDGKGIQFIYDEDNHTQLMEVINILANFSRL